jgi:predicted acylesterase/phospholipase RssA/CRP-like cAMP-binding protein
VPLIEEHPPLRLILSGTLQLAESLLARLGPVSCGPYSLVGIESVARWSIGNVAPLNAVLDPTTALYVLELPLKAFHRAFERDGRPLRRIRQASRAIDRARSFISAMLRDSYFANASVSDLYQLLQASTVLEGEQELSGLGEAFYALGDGTCRLDFDKASDSVTFKSPSCVGLPQLLDTEPRPSVKRALAQGSLASIPGTAILRLAQLSPSFKQALHRLPHSLTPPSPPGVRALLLATDNHLQVSLDALSTQLARTMASHLNDHVLLLRLLPEGPLTLGERQRQPDGGWVQEVTAMAPRKPSWLQSLLRKAIALVEESHPQEGRVDFTLIDASALPLTQQRGYALPPIEVVLLSATPIVEPPIEYILQQPTIRYAAVLDGRQQEGIGMTLQGLLQGKRPLKGATRELLTQLYELTKDAVLYPLSVLLLQDLDVPTWPVGTVILRLPENLRSPKEADQRILQRSLERWARAITDRRVGLALGGGGAYGFAHVPLIQRLIADRIVPIDMVSGASFGTFVGAYFCGAGLEGVDALASRAPLILAGALFGPISMAPLRWLVGFDVGERAVTELDAPLIPVVTNASIGVEGSLRNVTLGLGVQASGSLPPFTPTLINNRRYLDGGPTANVPVDILRQEGARLLIAANPIPLPNAEQPIIEVPILGPLWQLLSPTERLSDGIRVMQMMSRTVGLSQTQGPDVVTFNAPITLANPLRFLRARDIIRQVERDSEALNEAVAMAETRWFALQCNPVRVSPNRQGTEIELKGTLFLRDGALSRLCEPLLHELARYLKKHPELQSFQLSVCARSALGLAHAVEAFLKQKGVPQTMRTGVEPRVRPHHVLLTQLVTQEPGAP